MIGEKNKFRAWPVLAAAALLAILLLGNQLAGAGGYLRHRQQQRQMDALASQITQLKAENEQLGEQIRNLRSNPAAIEQYAREQLHLARPGELVVALPPAPSASPAAAPAPQQ